MRSHVGEDRVVEMICELPNVVGERIEQMKSDQEMEMAEDDKQAFESCSCCHIRSNKVNDTIYGRKSELP